MLMIWKWSGYFLKMMEQKQEESAALAKQTDEDIFAVTLKEVLIVFSSKKLL